MPPKKGQGLGTLDVTHPHLEKYWADERKFSEFTAGSHKRTQWTCELAHTYEAQTSNVAWKGTRCPYCSGHKVWEGYNDVSTTHPELVQEWGDAESPAKYSSKSHYKAKWVCGKCEHSWLAAISKRTEGRGCPVCAGRVVKVGYNDLRTTDPHLLEEWHDSTEPEKYTRGSNRRVRWRCSGAHEWEATVADRAISGKGCSKCSLRVSKGERSLAEWVKSQVPEEHVVTSDRTVLAPKELDIYIPTLRVALEYNGDYWHSPEFKPEGYHSDKTQRCAELGINLIHVWESEWRDNRDMMEDKIKKELGV